MDTLQSIKNGFTYKTLESLEAAIAANKEATEKDAEVLKRGMKLVDVNPTHYYFAVNSKEYVPYGRKDYRDLNNKFLSDFHVLIGFIAKEDCTFKVEYRGSRLEFNMKKGEFEYAYGDGDVFPITSSYFSDENKIRDVQGEVYIIGCRFTDGKAYFPIYSMDFPLKFKGPLETLDDSNDKELIEKAIENDKAKYMERC
jgi:hypothetical protein